MRAAGTSSGAVGPEQAASPPETASSPVLQRRDPFSFHRILVAYGGDRSSRHTLGWAQLLATPGTSKVILLTVIPPPEWYEFHQEMGRPGIGPRARAQERETRARNRLEDAAKAMLRSGVEVECIVVTGHPQEEVVRVAQEEGADLVIAGTRGHSPLRRTIAGSLVAGIRDCPHTSLLVATGPASMQGLLAANDGSRPSAPAARAAIGLAHRFGAKTQLLAVLETPAGFGGFHRAAEFACRAREAAASYDNDPLVRVVFRSGSAASTILQEARRCGASLIVVGSRGLRGWQRLLLGSVSRKVLHKSKTSVLLVKERRMLDRLASGVQA